MGRLGPPASSEDGAGSDALILDCASEDGAEAEKVYREDGVTLGDTDPAADPPTAS